jgi:hypothetical protein
VLLSSQFVGARGGDTNFMENRWRLSVFRAPTNSSLLGHSWLAWQRSALARVRLKNSAIEKECWAGSDLAKSAVAQVSLKVQPHNKEAAELQSTQMIGELHDNDF